MERPEHFPSFFLVGAPRCGTTAMARYLRLNPSVCFSKPKETWFFSSMRSRGQEDDDLQSAYIDRYFAHHDPAHHRVMGEGSVSDLYDQEALARILAIQPDAHFLVMVRDPLAMIPSYHLRMLYVMEEEVESLDRAWALQAARARGEQLPPRCTDPKLLQYENVGSLGRQVKALFDLVGRERCHVVVYDDLLTRPREVYTGVLDFIGAEDDGRTDFPRHQASRAFRSRWMQYLVFKPPTWLVKNPDDLRVRNDGIVGAAKRMRKRLMRRNKVAEVKPEVSPEMVETMRRAFADDVRLLGELLDRDLSHWLEGDRRIAA